MFTNAKFISSSLAKRDGATYRFSKPFSAKNVKKATLFISSLGIYEAFLNEKRVGDFILAPGWTSAENRLQAQTYDVTDLLASENRLTVTIADGFYNGMGFRKAQRKDLFFIASLKLERADGSVQEIVSDESWEIWSSPVLQSGFYFGEIYDASASLENHTEREGAKPTILTKRKAHLVPQQGPKVIEHESYPVREIITTPKGETVLDFGYNLVGYVEIILPEAKAGDKISYTHAEVLDKYGNFYTENLRSAQQKIEYTARDGYQTYKPHFTFMGGRYVRLDEYPYQVKKENFRFIVIHSEMKRTGYFECSSPLLNTLFDNIIRGQRGNYVDVPTDCPQRDERLGWTGDAQVFVRTAAYNFDVEKFFDKWLTDLMLDQRGEGSVPSIIPDLYGLTDYRSAAWQDAATVCPWEIYLAYGNKERLARQFASMQRYVDYIDTYGGDRYMWNADTKHYGDWLALDVEGSMKGGTSHPFIAQCFFAYSTSLLIKAGKVLGKDMTYYEDLYQNIRRKFQEVYLKDGRPIFRTQTACVLALHFNLCEEKDREKIADLLCTLIHERGDTLTTGFVGTPYLLHTLTETGHTDLAFTLLLQEKFPSWLFSVRMGATTIWEHWDGINEQGDFWSKAMNSFNHYAYGSVADWMYGVMLGINSDENNPAYKNIILKPHADKRLSFAKASVDTRNGRVLSEWHIKGDTVTYHFVVPETATADITIDGKTTHVLAGDYTFTSKI